MDVSERLRELVGARNRELAMEALVELGLGLLFSVLVFGFIFWTLYLVSFFCVALGPVGPWLAPGGTAFFAIVSCVSAWRRVDPMANVEALSDAEFNMVLVSAVTPVMYIKPRHAVAGAASVLLGGPANIVQAWSTWSHRIRGGRDVIERGAAMLAEGQRGFRTDETSDRQTLAMLHRLRLIRAEIRDKGAAYVLLTTKGEEVLLGTS